MISRILLSFILCWSLCDIASVPAYAMQQGLSSFPNNMSTILRDLCNGGPDFDNVAKNIETLCLKAKIELKEKKYEVAR